MSVRDVMARVRLAVSRAVVTLVADRKRLQELQITLLADEARAAVERFQQYGFTSVPLEGAEAIALAVGGSRSHMVVIAVDDRRYRPTGLKPGETCVYTDKGDRVHIREDGTIEVVASAKVYVDAPLVECTGDAKVTGDLHVGGNIVCDGDVSDRRGSMQEMRTRYNSHTHGNTPPPVPAMD